ncbi:DHHA1 domain-containing protein [Haloterrigena alkaliphila]|uniref:Alanyl-transfer RNA synthetases family profile domain-containing protein n=1 Tax=Haloterrigena alkaliphila TaxID=2816475 RepID=A0A8A2VGT3_9EURY|nr:DHHA1 domain-containing protein [Haloterrigena alkaliphila]QSW99584.1 DHHA1 domain-containing protein [Haloterrigena alkaliphila]
MTGQRAAAEPYTTRFETEVTSIDGCRVWLETSYFYGESGGQPADRGTIGGVEVADVRYVDGEHVHVLAAEPSFRVGQRVLCSIDWSFRMYCMRAHTASHVLYGAGRRLLEDLGYGGFDISEEKVRVDLETSTEIDDETLLELDTLVNRVVWESRPVTWEDVPVADARERDDVAFNEATEEGAFRKGRVRLVTIGSDDANGNANGLVRRDGGARDRWDVAACGGTHVRNTREVGPVTVLGRSNPGEGLTRVELAVGPRAIDRREAEKRVALASRRTLGAPLEEVEGELDRLTAEREELTDEVRSLRRELAETRLEGAAPFERDGFEWVATTLEDVDANEAGDVASDAAGELADVVVLAGDANSPYAVVATDGAVSAEDVVAELTDEFGGGGGGSATLAQAGGFDATPAEILAVLDD